MDNNSKNNSSNEIKKGNFSVGSIDNSEIDILLQSQQSNNNSSNNSNSDSNNSSKS